MGKRGGEKIEKHGQVNVAAAAIGAIIGILGIIIFAEIYTALNTENVSTSAVTLLNLVDLVLAAVLIIGIVMILVVAFGRR